MKKILSSLALASMLVATSNASEFMLDKAHTSIEFKVKHMMVSTTKGNFKNFDATIDFDENQKIFNSFSASVDTNSVDTNNQTRDNHLKAPDFLNAKKYEKITFTMSKYEKKSDDEGKMYGVLNINGVSKNVAFDVEIGGVATVNDKTKLGFDMELDILRKDYNIALENGESTIGNKVEIKVFVEANKK